MDRSKVGEFFRLAGQLWRRLLAVASSEAKTAAGRVNVYIGLVLLLLLLFVFARFAFGALLSDVEFRIGPISGRLRTNNWAEFFQFMAFLGVFVWYWTSCMRSFLEHERMKEGEEHGS